ncbi:DMT family transporter [Emcibacter sp.]|uniref:DMT family transporter n=1 Tax=Emcibacter sp. TaxID=1979954 RepID=UPI002AA67A7D|nr:DMT family transporter [Emcibacter sp.]
MYLLFLGLVWGTAFMFNKIAVQSIPPMTIAASRISLGALVVWIILRHRKLQLPSDLKSWAYIGLVGILGTAFPFMLVSWGVKYQNAGTAAICMSLIPLNTFVLAHFLTHDEKMSWMKLAGLLCGIVGILILFIDATLLEGSGLLPILGFLAFLLTGFFYSLSGVMIRHFKNKNPLVAATVMLICSSLAIWPLAMAVDQPWAVTPDAAGVWSIIFLGIMATGTATIVLVHLTHLAGATFVSYNTYLVPIVGVFSGYFWLDEPLKETTFASILFVLVGIYLTERWKPTAKKR